MLEFHHWILGLTKKEKSFFCSFIWEKELFLYLTTVCETFTDIFRNVLNMIVDPLRRVSGSQLVVVVFSFLTKCPSSLFLPFFSFSFSVTLTIAVCIFFAYTPGLLVTPKDTHRHCTPQNRAREAIMGWLLLWILNIWRFWSLYAFYSIS